MQAQGRFIIVDIGKTLAKVSLWSHSGCMLHRQVRPNEPLMVDGIARLDADGVADWLIGAIAAYNNHPVEAIMPVVHGAAVAAIKNEALVYQPFDYEAEPAAKIMSDYRTERDDFADTGSPALPAGLNFGAQLYWAEALQPDILAGANLLPWAQYWAWWLSGALISEVTSLGCHSDVWNPHSGDFSALAKRKGWATKFAPIAKAGDVVGSLKPSLASATGLSENVSIYAGLHDSNAALMAARGFPEIADNEATVISTGTWFIAMRISGEEVSLAGLPQGRDCLVNVDPYGVIIPSARFMGGREIESIVQIDTRMVDIKPDQPKLLSAVPGLVAQNIMLLPSLAPGSGPFPSQLAEWLNVPDDWHDAWYAKRAAACLYAAMVQDSALSLIGAKNCVLIEGRFAEAEVFVRALASLRPELTIYVANAHNDVALGALRLIDPSIKPAGTLRRVLPLDIDLAAYHAQWQKHVLSRFAGERS